MQKSTCRKCDECEGQMENVKRRRRTVKITYRLKLGEGEKGLELGDECLDKSLMDLSERTTLHSWGVENSDNF